MSMACLEVHVKLHNNVFGILKSLPPKISDMQIGKTAFNQITHEMLRKVIEEASRKV